eukprot:CAMPEP_0179476370 /NCGR_PEP_ID=MMETSP0799-20121207/55418_1 /TAXON_ID=46947 /ORGANISM="Geminigera cryophila, Strain CCMP2564" /LENGTH=178 /DNA_ID=CAMNT_0021286549 /DNA_START=72 /DNA_END=604 /DNA_ORIENTATION=+
MEHSLDRLLLTELTFVVFEQAQISFGNHDSELPFCMIQKLAEVGMDEGDRAAQYMNACKLLWQATVQLIRAGLDRCKLDTYRSECFILDKYPDFAPMFSWLHRKTTNHDNGQSVCDPSNLEVDLDHFFPFCDVLFQELESRLRDETDIKLVTLLDSPAVRDLPKLTTGFMPRFWHTVR